MKMKNRLIMILVATMLPINSFALNVEDTFTHKNARYLIDGISKGSNGDQDAYVITSTNTVKAKGSNVLGISDTMSSTAEWKDVVKDVGGTPLDDIVKIVYTTVGSRKNESLFAIDSNGALYQSTNNKGIARLIYSDSKVKDIVAGTHSLPYNFVTILTEDGKVYVEYTSSALDSKGNFKELALPNKAIKLIDSCVLHTNSADNISVVLLENGDLHKIVYGAGTSTLSDVRLSNVKDIATGAGTHSMLVLFQNGKLKHYNVYSDDVRDLDFGDAQILDIVSDNGNNKPLIVTSNGVYTTNGINTYKTNIQQRPVSIGGNTVLCDDGKYYKMTGSNETLSLEVVDDLDSMQQWSNENPIPPNETLASFEIDQDFIYKRKDEYDIKFSLVTQKQPKAFNLYYTKSNLAGDKLNWKLIDSNVTFESLNPQLYETEYIDYNSNKITGYTYTYKWRPTSDDINLTNIQLIAEPIY